MGRGGVGVGGSDALAMRSGVCAWLSGTLLGLRRPLQNVPPLPPPLASAIPLGRGASGDGTGASASLGLKGEGVGAPGVGGGVASASPASRGQQREAL